MCTVTYLPLASGFIITSNRDERLLRKPALPPAIVNGTDTSLLFPRDGEAGGTWIATAKNERTVCLLNGAYYPHVHQPPYRKSRGLVVLDFFDSHTFNDFVTEYNLQGIEPFTLLVAEHNALYELRWDGQTKSAKQLNEKEPHIRCSVTLYTPEVISMRERWFSNWLNTHKHFTPAETLHFHLFAGEGDETTQVRMRRSGLVQTVSVTCVEVNHATHTHQMFYSDINSSENFHFGAYSFSDDTGRQGISVSA
jgi:hypothetical protein